MIKDFHHEFQFPPSLKLAVTITLKYCW